MSPGAFGGIDAAVSGDTAGAVWVQWDGPRLVLLAHRIWRPTPSAPLDLEATIEAHVRAVDRQVGIVCAYTDPYQMHRSITTLQHERIAIEPYPQTPGNLTRAGQALLELLTGRNLRLYPSEELRAQALNTVAIESPRGWRIAKEKAAKKIDAIVALAMACMAAIDHKPPSGPGFMVVPLSGSVYGHHRNPFGWTAEPPGPEPPRPPRGQRWT